MSSEVCIRQYHVGVFEAKKFEAKITLNVYVK